MVRRPNIKDVAREAGVSKSTVSLVLQRSALVKEDTRKHVRETMARIGYVYNRPAANLRSASTGLMGLIINDLRNPFFAEFAVQLQMEFANHSYAVVLANINEDPLLQTKMIDALMEHGVSGFIISPAYGDQHHPLEAVARANKPAIQVFRKVDDRGDLFPFLAPDYQFGSRIATEHLFDRGCTRVGFVGGLAKRTVTQERMSGYLKVIEERRQQPVVITGDASYQFGFESAGVLNSEHPDIDGVLCFNDLVALGLIAASQSLGREIGVQLRVVGFDNIERSEQSLPPLTSVACGIPEFAKSISGRMLHWLSDGVAPNPDTRMPVKLIKRRSS